MGFGKSEVNFLENLKLVLERFKRFRVRLKISKCKFGYREIEFVGHLFNKDGYRLSDERKEQILD